MTPDDLLAALERHDAAMTKGPWWVESSRDNLPLIKYRWDDVPTWIAEASQRQNNATDFDGIAFLRTNLPRIVEALRRAERIEKASREVVEHGKFIAAHGSPIMRDSVDDLAAALEEKP